MADQTIGLLFMAYGTPGRPEDIAPYYTHIRGGRPPTPELLAELQQRYRDIGGRSPLNEITRAQAEAVAARLNQCAPPGLRLAAYIGMKHWHPFVEDTVAQMGRDGIKKAVAVALAPQYSRLSVAGYLKAVQKGVARLAEPIQFVTVKSYHDHPLFLATLAGKVRAALGRFPDPAQVVTVFTAHSLPQSIVEQDDPYPRHLRETGDGVARLVGLSQWQFGYQSAGRTAVPWLGPDIREVVAGLAAQGHRQILICPAGFVADHLEVLYDIDVECRQLARGLGVHLERTEMLNDDPHFIAALAAVVKEHVIKDEPAWLQTAPV